MKLLRRLWRRKPEQKVTDLSLDTWTKLNSSAKFSPSDTIRDVQTGEHRAVISSTVIIESTGQVAYLYNDGWFMRVRIREEVEDGRFEKVP